MKQEIFDLLEENSSPNILISFLNIEFFGPNALGVLINLDRKVKTAKGKLTLSNIPPEIYEVFAITRLDRLFDIQPDEETALSRF